MQALHKIHGLITYLMCTIYIFIIKFSFSEFNNLYLYLFKNFWKENCRYKILQFIYALVPMMI
jgi:hypothetical protein